MIFMRGDGFGYWMLDTGCWILDTGYWILDAGYWNWTAMRTKIKDF
jgi:hypothetical protein